MWHRIACRQHKSVQEAMEANTAEEFVELCVLMEEEWNEHTKQDYYLAQIVAEIRRFREGFSKTPKQVSVSDCLIPFERVDEDGTVLQRIKAPAKEIEVGPDAVRDPKWARTCENAKNIWAAAFKMERVIPDG